MQQLFATKMSTFSLLDSHCFSICPLESLPRLLLDRPAVPPLPHRAEVLQDPVVLGHLQDQGRQGQAQQGEGDEVVGGEGRPICCRQFKINVRFYFVVTEL